MNKFFNRIMARLVAPRSNLLFEAQHHPKISKTQIRAGSGDFTVLPSSIFNYSEWNVKMAFINPALIF